MMDAEIEMSSVTPRSSSEQTDDNIKPECTDSNQYGSRKYVRLKDTIIKNANNGRFGSITLLYHLKY